MNWNGWTAHGSHLAKAELCGTGTKPSGCVGMAIVSPLLLSHTLYDLVIDRCKKRFSIRHGEGQWVVILVWFMFKHDMVHIQNVSMPQSMKAAIHNSVNMCSHVIKLHRKSLLELSDWFLYLHLLVFLYSFYLPPPPPSLPASSGWQMVRSNPIKHLHPPSLCTGYQTTPLSHYSNPNSNTHADLCNLHTHPHTHADTHTHTHTHKHMHKNTYTHRHWHASTH